MIMEDHQQLHSRSLEQILTTSHQTTSACFMCLRVFISTPIVFQATEFCSDLWYFIIIVDNRCPALAR